MDYGLVHNQIKGVWFSLDSIFKGRTYDDVDESVIQDMKCQRRQMEDNV